MSLSILCQIFTLVFGETFQFLEDNSRPYRAAIVEKARGEFVITHLLIPPHTPDLKCMENSWDMVRITLDNHQPTQSS